MSANTEPCNDCAAAYAALVAKLGAVEDMWRQQCEQARVAREERDAAKKEAAGLRSDLEMVRGNGADIARRFAEHRESTSRYQAELRSERDAARAELARAQEILGIGDVLKR